MREGVFILFLGKEVIAQIKKCSAPSESAQDEKEAAPPQEETARVEEKTAPP